MPEIYTSIPGIEIEGKTFDDIQGETVTPKTHPFIDGNIAYFNFVTSGSILDRPLIDGRLQRISSIHKRSYQIQFGGQSSVVWADENGNLFTTLTSKGNNLASPRIEKSQQDPSGFRVFGLMDSDALVRILRVSRILREQGVDTECFLKMIEPQQLPFQGKVVLLDEFKSLLLQEFARDPKNASDIVPLSTHLDKSTLIIPIRALKVAERIEDLITADSKEQFQTISTT